MKIQEIVNSIFRQDFKNPLILGRTLFGLAITFIGLLNVFKAEQLALYAPDYLPVPVLLAMGSGGLLAISGFAIFANLKVERACQLLMIVLVAFILIVDLPTSEILDLSIHITLLAATILIHSIVREKTST